MNSYGTLLWVAAGERGLDRPRFAVHAVPHVAIRVKRLFPKARADRAGWVEMADTPEVAKDLAWLCDRHPLDMDSATRARLDAQAAAYDERHQAVDDILGGRADLGLTADPAREPRDYQLAAAAVARTTRRLLIADDLGLGKTMTSLLLLADPDALPALVVCPTHLPRQWLRELADTWPLLLGYAPTKGTPYDLSRVRGLGGRQPDVLVLGYSKLAGWSDALAGQVRTVIFDEAQELRHGIATQKGVGAARVTEKAEYAVGLTATPVYNYGDEVHNLYSILAPDALGTRDEFLREWGGHTASMGGHSTVSDPAALGTFLRDSGLMVRRTRADVHRELPEPLRIRQEVDADADALTAVRGDVEAMARLILDPSTDPKKRFTISGEMDWRLREATGIAKAPYAAEFVRMLLDAEHKIVLFGWHRAVYRVWLDALAEFHPVLYTGTESPTQKAAAADAFISGTARVLIVSLRSGAGLDGLQEAASACVFGELDWSPGVHDQCIGRLARDGQDATVAAYFLVCDQGADPVMDDVLELKRQQAEPIRNPDQELFEAAPDTSDRIRRLARAVLDGPNQDALL